MCLFFGKCIMEELHSSKMFVQLNNSYKNRCNRNDIKVTKERKCQKCYYASILCFHNHCCAVVTMQKLWFKFKLQWFPPVIWIPALNEDTVGGCGPVVRLLGCHARARRSVPHSKGSGISCGIHLSGHGINYTWRRVLQTWRCGPTAILTQW